MPMTRAKAKEISVMRTVFLRPSMKAGKDDLTRPQKEVSWAVEPEEAVSPRYFSRIWS